MRRPANPWAGVAKKLAGPFERVKPEQTTDMAEVVLKLGDRDRDVTVAVGDQLHVLLMETPSTGYRWTLSGAAPLLRQEASTWSAPEASHRPGAAGIRTISLHVVLAGEATLRFVHARSWEGGSEHECRLHVVVQDMNDERS